MIKEEAIISNVKTNLKDIVWTVFLGSENNPVKVISIEDIQKLINERMEGKKDADLELAQLFVISELLLEEK